MSLFWDRIPPDRRVMVEKIMANVREIMKDNDASHDYQHVLRVTRVALELRDHEQELRKQKVEHSTTRDDSTWTTTSDPFIVICGALLHEVADRKYLPPGMTADQTLQQLDQFLTQECGVTPSETARIFRIVSGISFQKQRSCPDQPIPTFEEFPEFCFVQDADRLEALGPLGVVRCAFYSGVKGNPLRTPETPSLQSHLNTGCLSPSGDSSFLDHFQHKLLHLHQSMLTLSGARLALQLRDQMINFLRGLEEQLEGIYSF